MIERIRFASSRLRRRRDLRLSAFLPCFLACITFAGCAGLTGEIEEAQGDDPDDRREAFLEIEERVRGFERSDPEADVQRVELDRFLSARYQREPDPGLRAQIISLALQAELLGTPMLLESALADRAWVVRQTAVIGLAETRSAAAAGKLAQVLRSDARVEVRIEAAKALGEVGNQEVVRPLIDVITDESEDPNLRYQAYRAALKLTRSDLPYVAERWRQYRDQGQP